MIGNIILLLVLFILVNSILSQITNKYHYTGGTQQYVVPNGVDMLYVQLWGAGGK